MKTYLINLERSKERRDHILAEVEREGLDFELVKAIDGLSLTEEDIDRYCDRNAIAKNPKVLSRGMMSCSLSHYKVYKKIIEDDVDVALVLEDDAVLSENFKNLVNLLKTKMHSDEVVSLHYSSFTPCKLSTFDRTPVDSQHTLYFPIDPEQVRSTAGYLITRKAVENMINILLPIRVSTDSWGFYYENKGFSSIRCIYPKPVGLLPAKSDIHVTGLKGRTTYLVSKYKIPVVSQALSYFRAKSLKNLGQVDFVDEKSAISQNMRW